MGTSGPVPFLLASNAGRNTFVSGALATTWTAHCE